MCVSRQVTLLTARHIRTKQRTDWCHKHHITSQQFNTSSHVHTPSRHRHTAQRLLCSLQHYITLASYSEVSGLHYRTLIKEGDLVPCTHFTTEIMRTKGLVIWITFIQYDNQYIMPTFLFDKRCTILGKLEVGNFTWELTGIYEN